MKYVFNKTNRDKVEVKYKYVPSPHHGWDIGIGTINANSLDPNIELEIHLNEQGFLHREDGPAWISFNTHTGRYVIHEYYWYGEQIWTY